MSPAAPMLSDVRDAPTARPATRATRLDTIVALTASDLRARYGRGRARVVKWLLDPVSMSVSTSSSSRSCSTAARSAGPQPRLRRDPVPARDLTIGNGYRARRSVRARSCSTCRSGRTLLPLASALTETPASRRRLLLLVAMMADLRGRADWDVLWLPAVLLSTSCSSTAAPILRRCSGSGCASSRHSWSASSGSSSSSRPASSRCRCQRGHPGRTADQPDDRSVRGVPQRVHVPGKARSLAVARSARLVGSPARCLRAGLPIGAAAVREGGDEDDAASRDRHRDRVPLRPSPPRGDSERGEAAAARNQPVGPAGRRPSTSGPGRRSH